MAFGQEPNDPKNEREENGPPPSEPEQSRDEQQEEARTAPPEQGYQAEPGAIHNDEDRPSTEEPRLGPPAESTEPAASKETSQESPGSGPPPQQQPPQGAAPPPPPRQQPPPRQGPPPGQQPPRMGPPPRRPQQPQQPGPPPPGFAQQGGGGWQQPPRSGPQQGPGGRPPFGPPPQAQQPGGGPPRGRNRLIPLIIGAVLFLLVAGGALIAGIAAMAGGSGGGSSFTMFGDRIGVLQIDGVIVDDEMALADSGKLVKQIDSWAENDSVKAMVLKINSPGGAVAPTQEIYNAIQKFREESGKPVVASMGSTAASGGYYAAMGADEVYANQGTLTGSIGVILNFWDYQELEKKIGLDQRPVKSGKFKDIGSGSRELLPAEKELLDDLVQDVFQQFFEVVAANRLEAARGALAARQDVKQESLTDSEVKAYLRERCDGRIFSGRQAAELGFVDGNKTYQEVLARARELADLPETAPSVVRPQRKQPGLFGSVNTLLNRINDISSPYSTGGVRVEYRMALQ